MTSPELQKLADSIYELRKKAKAKLATADHDDYENFEILDREFSVAFFALRSASRGLAELEAKGETL